jgi:sec-independent protein translocase protein TatB
MFGVDSGELLIIAVVALLIIGPKDLPKAMRVVGHWVGRARGMARHFRSGIDTMMRESELEEMEKKWREENDRIMRDHPQSSWDEQPAPPPAVTMPPEALLPPEAEPAAPAPPEGEMPPQRPEDDSRALP